MHFLKGKTVYLLFSMLSFTMITDALIQSYSGLFQQIRVVNT